jgi:hypothetical protein
MSAKMQALAKRAPLAKWWLPQIPEGEPLSVASGVGAFGPGVVGLTKMGAGAKIMKPFLDREVLQSTGEIVPLKGYMPEIDRMLKTVDILPKKLLSFLDDIIYSFKDPGSYQPKGYYNPTTPSQITLPQPGLSPVIFSRPLPIVHTFKHETGHLAEDVALRELGKTFSPNFYKKLSGRLEALADWYGQQLAAKTGTPYWPSRLETQAYNWKPSGVHTGMDLIQEFMPKQVISDPYEYMVGYLDRTLKHGAAK